jgi:phosphomannomutase/phosphoglucomutase
VVDIKASRNTVEYIKRHGGVPIMWKTGHSLVKQKMRQDNIGFGGELSGHMFMFEDYYPIDDGLFAACRVLQFLSKDEKKLSEYFADLPKLYSTHLIELPCDDAIKFDVIKKVQEAFLAKYEVNTIDGARVSMPGGWALVRASNTGPKIALRFEAETPERMQEIRSEVMETLNQFMPKP